GEGAGASPRRPGARSPERQAATWPARRPRFTPEMGVRHGAGVARHNSQETAMNASLRITILAVCALGLAACAGTQDRAAYVPPGQVGASPVNTGYVSNIERMARAQGIKVTWVNMPVKRSAQEHA